MRERNQPLIFSKCSEEGSFIPVAKVDHDQIESMLRLALLDWETLSAWQKHAPKNSGQWNALYKLAYDVLHSLCEAFLLFDAVKARTHECVFAYLCEKHPELEFHWDFFESIRSKRNRSVYYGEPISYEDWKAVEIQMGLYVRILKKTIEEKLRK